MPFQRDSEFSQKSKSILTQSCLQKFSQKSVDLQNQRKESKFELYLYFHLFIPLFGRAIFYTTAPTILLQHCGSSQSSGRKFTQNTKIIFQKLNKKDEKKGLIAKCGTNLSETCENFQHVFNIHICSTSYGKGDNLSKSVKHRIILTFSLFSILI